MVNILAEEAKAFLSDVPAQFVFRFDDRAPLHNLGELAVALENMSDETFARYAKADRNDFGRWIREIVKDD